MRVKKQAAKHGIAFSRFAFSIINIVTMLLIFSGFSAIASALPDLVGNSVSAPTSIDTDTNITVIANISNIGNQDANNFMNYFIIAPVTYMPSLLENVAATVATPYVADQPSAIIDSLGNLHLVWADRRLGNFKIFYKMFDKNMNVLIDDTQLTFTSSNSVRPNVAVDASNNLHIAWHDQRTGNPQIFYKKINPYLDDMDGGPALEANIRIVNDLLISANAMVEHSGQDAQAIVKVDSNQDIHIAFERTGDDSIGYAKLDNNGNFLIPDRRITTQYSGIFHSTPSMGIDSNNNVHLAWNDYGQTCDYELYYLMLNGSTGDALINASRISEDDCIESNWQKLALDSSNRVYIVTSDYSGLDSNIFFTSFDPYLASMNGQPANISLIWNVPYSPLLPDDGIYRTQPDMVEVNDVMHLVYYDTVTGPQELHLSVTDFAGNLIVNDVPISSGANVDTWTGFTLPTLAVGQEGDGTVLWTDYMGQYVIDRSSYHLQQSKVFDQQQASANAGQTIFVPATLNTSGLLGAFDLFVTIDAANIIAEDNESNNFFSYAMPIIQGGDLIVEEILTSPNESISTGTIMNITAIVKNSGIADLAGYLIVDFYVDDLFVTSKLIQVNLTAGSSIPIVGTWQTMPGNHVIKAVVNSYGWIAEQDYGNNENSLSLPFIAGPDVIVTGITWAPNDSITSLGSIVTLNATIMNVGGTDVVNAFYVAFYVNDIFVGNAYVPASTLSPIPVNTSVYEPFQWTVSAGNKTNLSAIADAYNYVFEQDENNNQLWVPFQLEVGLPDLIVS